jgi:hypothetical protein
VLLRQSTHRAIRLIPVVCSPMFCHDRRQLLDNRPNVGILLDALRQ